MQIDGIHHITAITGNAPQNVEFYVGVLGLRLVKKTVNQDDPGVYHLFYADDDGSPGADLTFFEYPGARRGVAGAGFVHRIIWRVPSLESLDYWEARLRGHAERVERTDSTVRFADPEGLGHELIVDASGDVPLIASSSGVDPAHALCGFDGVRAYVPDPSMSRSFLVGTLMLALDRGEEETDADVWRADGSTRHGSIQLDPAPSTSGVMGAGVVHHVAFTIAMDDYEKWNDRVAASGLSSSGMVDRFYFRSIYVREPGGVLIELATNGPGFSVDEPQETLGKRLSLPPRFESMRADIERNLTPLPSL